MSGNGDQSGSDPRERTVKTAGRIVKYSREIYRLESVEEVAMLSMEAAPRIIDGHPSPTVAEIRNDDVRVLESLHTGDLVDSVFSNILVNAAVHNENEVTVAVRTEEPSPGTVLVGFADNGEGIPEEVRDGIFEMGKKGPDSDGTGFGLGLARTVVESYGGSVEVRESKWGGADFRIRLESA